MNITCTEDLEIPAPLDAVLVALQERATWKVLPTGARHMGEMWHWGRELYTIQFESSLPAPPTTSDHQAEAAGAPVLRWHVCPVTVAGASGTIEVVLHDALISTHATIHVSLTPPAPPWPWQRWLARQKIAAIVRACAEKLRSLLHQPDPTDQQPPSFSIEWLRTHYPRTVAAFEAMGAPEHLEYVWKLTQRWGRIIGGACDPSIHTVSTVSEEASSARPGHRGEPDYDLVYAGGGMSLLHAAVMVRRYGRRVMVFDQYEVGRVHREWNISRNELHALVDIGLLTGEELETVIMREYRTGLVSYHTSARSTIPHSDVYLPNVLNVAVDSHKLLRLVRQKLEEAGATILDHRTFRRVRVSPGSPLHVTVELECGCARGAPDPSPTPDPSIESHTARLLLDGMGITSPLSLLRFRGCPFDGFCPTVGTVVGGLAQGSGPRTYDPTVGDILVSVEDTQGERQFIWEGFPGRDDEMTVYLFYYAALDIEQRLMRERQRKGGAPYPSSPNRWSTYSLFELYEHYLTLLATYKEAGPNFHHVKPVYGYIPGRHTMHPQSVPLLRGVLPIGDSASLQSPLTFCGFGSNVRNLHRTTSLLDYALHHHLTEPRHLCHVSTFQVNTAINWVFSNFMQAWGKPHYVNELQNVFLGSLNQLGLPLATRLYQDHMRWSDYNRIVWAVLMRYPIIVYKAWEVLRLKGIYRWERDYLLFGLAAAYAALGRKAGPAVERTLYRLGDRLSPQVGLYLRAQYAEWRVMQWLDHDESFSIGNEEVQ
jgi:lycopene cyclase CruA